MSKIFLISLLLSGCATTYEKRKEYCFKIMEQNKIPRCNNMKDFKGWEDTQVMHEIGFRSGFFWGCMGIKK